MKEKFGTLRCYLDYNDEMTDKIIAKAEKASAVTCEICGARGSINKGPWYSVRCKSCRAKEAKRCKT